MSSEVWGGVIGAALGSFFTALFAWLAQRRKSESDVEIAVIDQWQKLNGALSDRLTTVEKEFADYRNAMSRDLAKLRKDHGDEISEMRNKHRAEMRAMRELNEGLQRQIAQNSQSGAQLLGDLPFPTKQDDGKGL